MPDRRQFLRGLAGMVAGQVILERAARSRRDQRQVVILRQGERFVLVDPASGTIDAIDLPPDTQRVKCDPMSGAILVELDTGAWRVGPFLRDATLQVKPLSPDRSPLLIGGRVIGVTVAGDGVVVHDLVTGRSEHVTNEVLPGPPSGWHIHEHPLLPAAALDARQTGGGVVLLPAATQRVPRVMTVPPGSALGIAPDGNGLVRVDRAGDISALVWMPAANFRPHDLAPRFMLGTGDVDVIGPMGVSTNVLLAVDRDRVPVLSCDAGNIRPVDELVIDTLDGESGIGTWFASPEGDAIIVGLTHGSFLSWAWWSIGLPLRMLPELPATLEPGMPAGAAGRWFHGADMNETSLGSGELRLITIDMQTGETVFDHTVDRRLELAATGISPDGSLLAHCQSGNAGIELLVASFGVARRNERFRLDIEDAPVAAAEIVLDVVASGGRGVVAAGLKWGNPDHHAPLVVMCAVGDNGPEAPTSVDGALVGVVPDPATFNSSWPRVYPNYG